MGTNRVRREPLDWIFDDAACMLFPKTKSWGRGEPAWLVPSSFCARQWGQQANVTSTSAWAEKLHAAYSARDLDTIDALWSDRCQHKTTHREATQGLPCPNHGVEPVEGGIGTAPAPS
jgi:hypothetical protein